MIPRSFWPESRRVAGELTLGLRQLEPSLLGRVQVILQRGELTAELGKSDVVIARRDQRLVQLVPLAMEPLHLPLGRV